MPRYDLEILIRTKKEGNGIPAAGKEIDNFGQRLNKTLGVIQASAAAAIAAGATFKKAFDLGSEGASLNQLTDSFNNFNDSVLQTPDLLDQIHQASGGVIADNKLMSGLLTLTAGASDEYAQGLSAVYPHLVEIARASNKLNPALGDTSFLLESLTKAAKRQSVPIADNLGLIIKMDNAVQKVHPSLQGLASDYDQLSEQQKFLNELLFQGDQLINQVGGDVSSQTDSWQRLGVQVETATNKFKQWLADGLTPVVRMINGDYANAVDGITKKNIESSKSLEDLIDAYKKTQEAQKIWGGFGAVITGTDDDILAAQTDLRAEIANSVNSFEEYVAVGEKLGFVYDQYDPQVRAATRAFYDQARAVQELARQTDFGRRMAAGYQARIEAETDAVEEQEDAYRRVLRVLGVHGPLLSQDTREMEDAAYASGELGDAQDRLRGYIEADTEAIRLQAEAHQKLVDSTRNAVQNMRAGGIVDELFQAQMDLAAAQGEWVSGYRDVSGELTDISSDLARDLTDDQRNAFEDILDTVDEGSAEWLSAYNALQGDLTKSQRQELVARQAELASASGEMVSYFTGDAEAAEDAQQRIDAAYDAVSANYRQVAAEIALQKISETFAGDALAAQEAYLQTQVALGNLSQDQADFLLDVQRRSSTVETVTSTMFDKFLEDGVLTQEESAKIAAAVSLIEQSSGDSMLAMQILAENGITDLAALEGGTTTATDAIIDMKDEAQELVDSSPYAATIEADTEDAMASINELAAAAEAAAGNYSINFDIGVSGAGIPGGTQLPEPGGGATKLAGGTKGQFISVPQNFPGDSYPVWMQTGEDFMVRTPADRARGVGMGGGGITIDKLIIMGLQPGTLYTAVTSYVDAELGKLGNAY